MLKLTIEGVHINLDSDLEKYATKKVGSLEKYIPRKARGSAHAEVILKRKPSRDKNKFCCEITLHLPHEKLNCEETTQHLYAAIDIASAKAQHQLLRYKEEHNTSHVYRRFFDRRNRPVEP